MSDIIRRQVDTQTTTISFNQKTMEQEMAIFRTQFREMARDNEWQIEHMEVIGLNKAESDMTVMVLVVLVKYEYLSLEDYQASKNKNKRGRPAKKAE